MNISALLDEPYVAEEQVLQIQAKLHCWARDDPQRRFDDLFNFVYDPAVLVVAWRRVVANKGARTAGVDGQTARYIKQHQSERRFLEEIRADLKARSFEPLPVRERLIPKPGRKVKRRLGIPATRDRVVQAALKLILAPIFEADFEPCSYGFRPGRRTHDAIAETRQFTSKSYEWIVEGDIEACFDEISHSVLLGRVRDRIKDKRVVTLVKAFLKAGILTEAGAESDSNKGTPQGGILSPLLSNIALSILDEHFAEKWQEQSATEYARRKRRQTGKANVRLIRYADDFLLLLDGNAEHATACKAETAEVLAAIGLRLSAAKTRISHIDEGVDFLGVRIQRHRSRSNGRLYVYTYPSKAALQSIMAKVKALTGPQTLNMSLKTLLIQINRKLRGWANYHRYGVSQRTFAYVGHYTWYRLGRWLRKKHSGMTWRTLNRRFFPGGIATKDGISMFNPQTVTIERYRYRGTKIPNPWQPITQPAA